MIPSELEDRIRNILTLFKATDMEVEPFLASLERFQAGGYGGNTPCFEVKSEKAEIIIDGGSGLRIKGLELLKGPCGKGQGEVHIFMTHFHWDHLIGIPFFVPLFIPGNQIHFYAVQPELNNVFSTLFKKPYFPVELQDLGGTIHTHQLEPRSPLKMNDMTITPYQLDHPDPCWGFKIENGQKSYAHCVDTECTRVSRAKMGDDLPLYQNIDLMVFDSQYTLSEIVDKIHWGHSAAPIGLDIALREKIKKVVFLHHDPSAPDEKIGKAILETQNYYNDQLKNNKDQGIETFNVDWCFGHEGMVIEV